MTIREAYEILGVNQNASAADIKAAYRRRVSETHPDKGGSPAEFIRVRAAYEIAMAYLNEAVGEEDAPLPPELRAIIDEIVKLFRAELAYAEQETERWLDDFHANMAGYVATAPRYRLRQFGTYFATNWNQCIGQLFTHFNGRCDALLATYENWFRAQAEPLCEEAYRRRLRTFWSDRRFWLITGSVVIVWAMLSLSWVEQARVGRVIVGTIMAAGFGAFVYWLDVRSHRPPPKEAIRPLDIVPYRFDQRVGFMGSEALRKGRAETAGVSAAGFVVGDILTAGLGGPVLGALLGWTFGEIGDRLSRPTPMVRAALHTELDRFMQAVKPELTRYILETQQELLKDIRAKVIANYQDKMRHTVRLLTSGRESR